ncbi:sensory rhodopsin transducer [Nonomuraea sp. NPDC049504]|uniref:sensory rhodopsin transducer n=1 Tax=Nonomuraea sp. NPDC049504 TaxID=3154729 RepID=UPI003429CA5C
MSTMAGSWKMTIADGCRPGDRLSLLNLSPGPAHVEVTLCAQGDRPRGPIRLTIPPRRTRSSVVEDLMDKAGTMAPGPAYTVVVVSDAPVLVQPHRAGRQAPELTRPAA